MADEREALRDWHRLFGQLLTDYFTGTPFTVEVERDLSQQQQFLDVIILRRGPGRFPGRLPDGLHDLVEHNLISFKVHPGSAYLGVEKEWTCCSHLEVGKPLTEGSRQHVHQPTVPRLRPARL
jgi:hypothetical protein